MTRETTGRRNRNEYNNRRISSNSSYVYGSTVPKLNVVRELEQPQREQKPLSHTTKRNREKASHMNLGYVLFLTLAMVIAASTLIGYIRLQAGNTSKLEQIAQLESQLNETRLSNNEEYSRAVSSVDLEKVKEIAINELGMKYAEKGQVVNVEGVSGDYVRQYSVMP